MEYRDIPITHLQVNSDNARFIKSDDFADERDAIESLVKMKKGHLMALAEDIYLNGLNPHEFPIVMNSEDNPETFVVLDGNRRISAIKLMTQYKSELGKFGFSKKNKDFFSSLRYPIPTVKCAFYDKADEDIVNRLLAKIHTSKPGVGQVKWDPLAQDRHQYRVGYSNRRLAVIEMLKASKHTPQEVKDFINAGKFASKLQRYVRSKESNHLFGLAYENENHEIILKYNEEVTIKALGQLVYDLQNTFASQIAQPSTKITEYLTKRFPVALKPTEKDKCNPLIKFDVRKGYFLDTDRFIDVEIDDVILTGSFGTPSTPTNSNVPNDININVNQTTTNKPITNFETPQSSIATPVSSTQNKVTIGVKPDNNESTSRNNIVPFEHSIPIKDEHVKGIYNELQQINFRKYLNMSYRSLKSLITLSVSHYLLSVRDSKAFAQDEAPIKKFERALIKLEENCGLEKLRTVSPKIYQEIDKSLEWADNPSGILTILHEAKGFTPEFEDTLDIYNGFTNLLNLIWTEIK